MKTIILSLMITVLFLPCARGQDTLLLPLNEAIEIGISKSVDATVARNEYISSYWEYRAYKTELLPEVVLNTTIPHYSKSYNQYQNENGDYSFVPNHYNRIDAGVSVTQNIPWTGGVLSVESSFQRLQQSGRSPSFRSIPFSVTLEQPVFGFNRIKWLKRIEPIKYTEAKQRLVSSMEEVANTVIQYYFDLLLGEVNREIAQQNHQNAEKLFAFAQAKRKLGQLSETELQQMEVSLLNARSAAIDAAASIDARMFQLRSLLGLGETTILKPRIPEIPIDRTFQLSYPEVLNMALRNNAFTHNIQRRMLEADRELSAAKANRRDMKLFVSFGMSGQENDFRNAYQTEHWRDDQVVTVGIRVPILDWGRGRSKVEIAQARLEVANSKIKKEQIDFNQDIYLRVQYFNNQPQKLQLSKEANEIARKRYATTIDAFILGKIDILTLNDSQVSKDDALRNYIEQIYLLWSYYYQIRSLTLYDFVHEQELSVTHEL